MSHCYLYLACHHVAKKVHEYQLLFVKTYDRSDLTALLLHLLIFVAVPLLLFDVLLDNNILTVVSFLDCQHPLVGFLKKWIHKVSFHIQCHPQCNDRHPTIVQTCLENLFQPHDATIYVIHKISKHALNDLTGWIHVEVHWQLFLPHLCCLFCMQILNYFENPNTKYFFLDIPSAQHTMN